MKSPSKRRLSLLDAPEFNREAHFQDREPKTLFWTSTATLVTTAGTNIYVLRGRRIVRVRVSVAGAPNGAALAADLLIDGQSAFSAIDSKLQVRDGQTMGDVAYLMGGRTVPPDGRVQCQVTTVSSATGPAVFEIEYY